VEGSSGLLTRLPAVRAAVASGAARTAIGAAHGLLAEWAALIGVNVSGVDRVADRAAGVRLFAVGSIRADCSTLIVRFLQNGLCGLHIVCGEENMTLLSHAFAVNGGAPKPGRAAVTGISAAGPICERAAERLAFAVSTTLHAAFVPAFAYGREQLVVILLAHTSGAPPLRAVDASFQAGSSGEHCWLSHDLRGVELSQEIMRASRIPRLEASPLCSITCVAVRATMNLVCAAYRILCGTAPISGPIHLHIITRL